MDFSSPHYSLLAIITVALASFVIGRVTAGRNDPRRQEEKKRQARAYDAGVNKLKTELSSQTAGNIRTHMSKGELIQAVKLVRDELHCGLKEAKDIAESFGPKPR